MDEKEKKLEVSLSDTPLLALQIKMHKDAGYFIDNVVMCRPGTVGAVVTITQSGKTIYSEPNE